MGERHFKSFAAEPNRPAMWAVLLYWMEQVAFLAFNASGEPMPAGANKPIRSVAFVSLGCPKNLVDSERMLGLLAQDGLALTPDADAADAIVINTCGFV